MKRLFVLMLLAAVLAAPGVALALESAEIEESEESGAAAIRSEERRLDLRSTSGVEGISHELRRRDSAQKGVVPTRRALAPSPRGSLPSR